MSHPGPPLPRAIRVSDLTVSRGERVLIDHLDFLVPQGEVLLVRGPNGAGKTTLLMTLAGQIRPDIGAVEFISRDPEARPGTDIHFVGHQSGIKARLTLTENLRFWAAVNGGDVTSIEGALAEVGLAAISGLEAGHLSAGQIRRLTLARLLTAQRPIWLLDEPTAALDTAGDALVGRLIDRHRDAGGITIAATHHDLTLSELPESLVLTGGR